MNSGRTDLLFFDPLVETMGREACLAIQLRKLKTMLGRLLQSNAFYKAKLNAAGVKRADDVATRQQYERLPFTTRAELNADQQKTGPWGTNLTFPVNHYRHYHQSAVAAEQPLRWLDTAESWSWVSRCWRTCYRAVGVTPDDNVLIALTDGPSMPFWGALSGARELGALAMSGGGMTTAQRLEAIQTLGITALVTTPTDALQLADLAARTKVDIARGSVRLAILTGEPGAGIAATNRRISTAWGAKIYDHAGSTETGPWGFACTEQGGLHVNEGEFIAEILDPASGRAAYEGELVLTNLGRFGMPIVRYRTNCRVRSGARCGCGRTYLLLEDGILGRFDGAVMINGRMLHPRALAAVVKDLGEYDGFRAELRRRPDGLSELVMRVEVRPGTAPNPGALQNALQNLLSARVVVELLPPKSLGPLTVAELIDRRE